MLPKAFAALCGSIQKWHDIAYHDGVDHGGINCPLCAEFNRPDMSCRGCPVKDFTGKSGCYGTPYDGIYFSRVSNSSQRQQAIAELKFLVCLLPENSVAQMADGTLWYWEWQ